MRLWHYELIPYLPKAMLVSQWRECIAIKRQWEKGTLKHRLVSYVMNHDKGRFWLYCKFVVQEMKNRNIKFKEKYLEEIASFCEYHNVFTIFPEHNNRYLKQCLYNLQEKVDRGIITEEEWQKTEDTFGEVLK